MRASLRLLGLGALALATAGCPTPSTEPLPLVTGPGNLAGPPVSALLGPDGGGLASADARLTLRVPPGALSGPSTFSITPVENLAPGGLGYGYELGSGGAALGLPVSLTLSPSAEDLAAGGLEVLGLAWQDDGGAWHRMEGAVVDPDAGTVTVAAAHFTRFGPSLSHWLVPLYTEVKEGQSTQLEVHECYAPHGTGGMVGIACRGEPLSSLVVGTSEWSVNGHPGGDSTHGTLQPTGMQATYTAPATAPSPPTVDVTTRLQLTSGKTLLFSHVRVGEVVDLQGTLTLLATLPGVDAPFTVEASAVLTRHDTGPDETNYLLGGTATIRPSEFTDQAGTHCTLVSTGAQAIPRQDSFKVRLTPVTAVAFSYTQSFTFRCQLPGIPTPFDRALPIQFMTKLGEACSQRIDVPTANPKAPRGSFLFSCIHGYSTLATWSFSPR